MADRMDRDTRTFFHRSFLRLDHTLNKSWRIRMTGEKTMVIINELASLLLLIFYKTKPISVTSFHSKFSQIYRRLFSFSFKFTLFNTVSSVNPQISLVTEDAGIEPMTVATSALAACQGSNNSARSHLLCLISSQYKSFRIVLLFYFYKLLALKPAAW
jgi:hypothetical protein